MMRDQRSSPISCGLLVGLALLTGVTTLHGQRELSRVPYYIFPTCLDDLAEIRIPRVFAGCQLPDCCPRCARGASIDWRIAVDGPVQQVILHFEHLNVPRGELSVQGRARWQDDSTLVLGAGESAIRGLPAATPENVVSALPQAQFDTVMLRRRLAEGQGGHSGAPFQLDVRITLEQLIHRIVVQERVILYRFRSCAAVRIPSDRIQLSHNTGADQAVVFLSARRASGCVLHEIVRGAALFTVGSVLSNQTCRSEAAVFSDDDAVQLLENINVWTDALGDLLPVDLDPDRWQAPVDVWITSDGLQARSHEEMTKADNLLNVNHAGIDVLSRATYKPVLSSGNAVIVNTVAQKAWDTGYCTELPSITGNPAIFTPGRINVYFVDQAFTGLRCPATSVIFVGTVAQKETLAHEFGHAFSLLHTNEVDYDGDGTPDFPSTNLMIGQGSGRTTFTEGQCFRMTLNPSSMLNVNGVRTAGPVRPCPDSEISDKCPWAALDALPN